MFSTIRDIKKLIKEQRVLFRENNNVETDHVIFQYSIFRKHFIFPLLRAITEICKRILNLSFAQNAVAYSKKFLVLIIDLMFNQMEQPHRFVSKKYVAGLFLIKVRCLLNVEYSIKPSGGQTDYNSYDLLSL